MSQPTLLSLPAEVRLNIYSYLFADESVYIDPCVHQSDYQRSNQRQQYGAPILDTCQQLRDEASPYYFATVRVCFDVCKSIHPVGLFKWLQDIGEANVKLLRHFEMRWSDYVDIRVTLARKQSVQCVESTRKLHDTNSTKRVQTGAKHILSIQGIPEHEPEYWKRMGTSDFCDVLSKQMSSKLENLLDHDGLYLSVSQLGELIAEADGHAAALRWLWFW